MKATVETLMAEEKLQKEHTEIFIKNSTTKGSNIHVYIKFWSKGRKVIFGRKFYTLFSSKLWNSGMFLFRGS